MRLLSRQTRRATLSCIRRLQLEPLEDRRLLAAGDLDTTFGTGGIVTTGTSKNVSDSARDLAIYPSTGTANDGKIVLAGTSGGRFAAARYRPDGTLDSTFGSGGKVTTAFSGTSAKGNAVALQGDGKVVIVGTLDGSSASNFGVLRYTANGSVDNSFGKSGKVTVDFGGRDEGYAIVIQPGDGKIIVTGRRYDESGICAIALARLNTNGGLDNSFGNGGKVLFDLPNSCENARGVALQTDGKIVVAGSFNDGNTDILVARFNPNGTSDVSFGTAGFVVVEGPDIDILNAVAIYPTTGSANDGKIVAVGEGFLNFLVARYNTDGSLDTTFGGTGVVRDDVVGTVDLWDAFDVVIQPDQRLIVGGAAQLGDVYSQPQFAVARYNNDGTLDSTFGIGGVVATVIPSTTGSKSYGIALQADGNIVAAGQASMVGNALEDFAVARYLAGSGPIAPAIAVPQAPSTNTDSTSLSLEDAQHDVVPTEAVDQPIASFVGSASRPRLEPAHLDLVDDLFADIQQLADSELLLP